MKVVIRIKNDAGKTLLSQIVQDQEGDSPKHAASIVFAPLRMVFTKKYPDIQLHHCTVAIKVDGKPVKIRTRTKTRKRKRTNTK